jgi:hypothetical protein
MDLFSKMVGGSISLPTNESLPQVAGVTGIVGIAGAVIGHNYQVCSLRDDRRIKLPLIYEKEPALIALDVKP